MTKTDARVLLRDCGGFGGLEAWIAGRRWKTTPGGWLVTGELQGWSFHLEPVVGGHRIAASAPGGAPAVWIVTRGASPGDGASDN
ncbi:MAG TPA: hypothetical protein VGC80_03855 [Acetobacteraceae bacterium]